MEITQQIRDYVKEKGIGEATALEQGMDEIRRSTIRLPILAVHRPSWASRRSLTFIRPMILMRETMGFSRKPGRAMRSSNIPSTRKRTRAPYSAG